MPKKEGENFLRRVLAAHPAQCGYILENEKKFRFQVLLSQPQSSSQKITNLRRHGHRVDHEYFYPASAIKLCGAIAALQKLKELQESAPGVDGLSPTCPLKLLPLFNGEKLIETDASNLDGQTITIANEIRKIFLTSDNTAFNRLFALVGQRSLNTSMWALTLQSTRLRHRVDVVRSLSENRLSEAIQFGESFCIPPKWSSLVLPPSHDVPGFFVGSSYIDEDGALIDHPMDFSQKNRMELTDLQDLLVALMRPDINTGKPRLELDEGMRLFMLEAMVQYPRESRNPQYNQKTYPDDYCKFFLPGLCRVRPKGALRIYNKIGQAYGFTVDNSYILDIETGRDFFLSMVLYSNANGVLNDDKYEYEFAYRAFADVAEVLARAVWQIPPRPSMLACLSLIPRPVPAVFKPAQSERNSQHSSLPDDVPPSPGLQHLSKLSLGIVQPGTPEKVAVPISCHLHLPMTMTDDAQSDGSLLHFAQADDMGLISTKQVVQNCISPVWVHQPADQQLATLNSNDLSRTLNPCYRYFRDE